MANFKVRYLTVRAGAGDELRYFWQPNTALRAAGWQSKRLPENWAEYTDPEQLEAAAIAAAQDINKRLDAQRGGAALHATPAPPVPTGRTLGALIKLYQASDDFAGLAEKTRRGYRQCLLKLADWAADAPVHAIDTLRIQRLKKGLSATLSYSNAVIRVLRLLLAFGRREGWLVVNLPSDPAWSTPTRPG